MSSTKNRWGGVAAVLVGTALVLPIHAQASSGEWQCQGGRLMVDSGNGLTDVSTVDETTWNALGTGYSYSQFVSAYSDASRQLCARTAAAQTTQMRVSTTQTASLISQRAAGTVRALRGPRQSAALASDTLTGQSAGSGGVKTGLWANYDHTRASDDNAGVDSRLNNFIVGGDRKISDKLAVGGAFSYQNTERSLARSDAEAWTVTPYMAYLINDNLSVDAMVGYTWMNEENPLGGRFDTRRYFAASNLSAFTTDLDRWEIGGHVGFLFADDTVDAYGGAPQNAISFLQAKTGVEASYAVHKSAQTYFTMDYEQDLVYEAAPGTYDDAGFVGGLGARFDLSSALLGDLRYGKSFGRRNFDQDAFTANLRMNF
ncbi:MAG: autotransporter domain-containing protein [Magnetococcus sp. MYC-9]